MSYSGRWSGNWDGAWDGGAVRPPGFMAGRTTLGITAAGRLTDGEAPVDQDTAALIISLRRRAAATVLRRRREEEDLLVALM